MNKSDDETLTFKEMVGKFDVTPRTRSTNSPSNRGSWPNSMPPLLTWGQDALISIPATRGDSDRRSANSA